MTFFGWSAPRCLIESTEDNTLKINDESIQLLKEVKVPVHVVAIAGLYRTGKSYLMNKLAGRNSGFDLGSTIQAKTKGIWAWCCPHPGNKRECLLLLDTEGLGDPEKGDKDHDAWIFVLAILLSNTLIYNSTGTIDQDALDKLHFITDISEHVKVKTGSKDDCKMYDGYFPDFIWAVRDFHLKLEIDGKPVTADEYLEHTLQIKKGLSQKKSKYNAIRQSLKQYFPSRKCFVFPQPLDDMEMITELEFVSNDKLKKEFSAVTAQIFEYVINKSRPKSIRGASVNGSGLADLCEIYVKAIQDGAVPCIENAVDSMARSANTEALEGALQLYSSEIRMISFPTETPEQLSKHHQQCEEKAIAAFIKVSIFDTEQTYQTKLGESIIDEYQKVRAKNEKVSSAKCQEFIEKLYTPVARCMKSGYYAKPGGYKMYKTDMDCLEFMYGKLQCKGVKAAETLQTFMEGKRHEHDVILAADSKLSAEQKKLEEMKRKAAQSKRAADAAKVAKERMAQVIKDQEKSFRLHERQLNEKIEKDMENLTQQHDKQLKKRLKEQEEMLRNGFKKEAEALQAEIDSLKNAPRPTVTVVKKSGCAIM